MYYMCKKTCLYIIPYRYLIIANKFWFKHLFANTNNLYHEKFLHCIYPLCLFSCYEMLSSFIPNWCFNILLLQFIDDGYWKKFCCWQLGKQIRSLLKWGNNDVPTIRYFRQSGMDIQQTLLKPFWVNEIL